MKFEIVTINPSRDEQWQMHRAGCSDVEKSRRNRADITPLEAENSKLAEEVFFDAELRDMGFSPGGGTLRVMPCCKQA